MSSINECIVIPFWLAGRLLDSEGSNGGLEKRKERKSTTNMIKLHYDRIYLEDIGFGFGIHSNLKVSFSNEFCSVGDIVHAVSSRVVRLPRRVCNPEGQKGKRRREREGS